MIAAGPFIPHPDTPFSSAETSDIELSYRFTALARMLNPLSNIPATSALDSFDSKGREKGLQPWLQCHYAFGYSCRQAEGLQYLSRQECYFCRMLPILFPEPKN